MLIFFAFEYSTELLIVRGTIRPQSLQFPFLLLLRLPTLAVAVIAFTSPCGDRRLRGLWRINYFWWKSNHGKENCAYLTARGRQVFFFKEHRKEGRRD